MNEDALTDELYVAIEDIVDEFRHYNHSMPKEKFYLHVITALEEKLGDYNSILKQNQKGPKP